QVTKGAADEGQRVRGEGHAELAVEHAVDPQLDLPVRDARHQLAPDVRGNMALDDAPVRADRIGPPVAAAGLAGGVLLDRLLYRHPAFRLEAARPLVRADAAQDCLGLFHGCNGARSPHLPPVRGSLVPARLVAA